MNNFDLTKYLAEGKLFEEDFKNPILDKYLELKKSIDYKTVFPTDLQSFLDSLDNTEREGLKRDLAEGKLLKEDISSHKKEAKRFLEKFIDDNKDEFEFIPDLETGYIDAKDNSYNVDELASIFLDIGQDIPRGKYNQKYKGEGGTYVVVAENKLLKENLSSRAEELEMDFMDPRNKFGDEWQEEVSNVLVRKYDGHWENWENENPKELEMLLNKFKNLDEGKLLKEESKPIFLTPIQKKRFKSAIRDLSKMEDFEYALGEAGTVLANILTNGKAEFIEDVEGFGYDADEVEQYAMDLAEGKLLKENITKLDNYALEIYSDFRKDPSIHFPDVEFEVDEEGFALENDSNYSQLKKYKREIMGLHALFGEESGVKDKNGLQLSMDDVIDNI